MNNHWRTFLRLNTLLITNQLNKTFLEYIEGILLIGEVLENVSVENVFIFHVGLFNKERSMQSESLLKEDDYKKTFLKGKG